MEEKAATTFFLELEVGVYQQTIHRMAFSSYEKAREQLDLLEPLMGHGPFRNDPEKNRVRVISDDGEIVVVIEHLRTARVIDRAKYDTLTDYAKSIEHEERVDLIKEMANLLSSALHGLKDPQEHSGNLFVGIPVKPA